MAGHGESNTPTESTLSYLELACKEEEQREGERRERRRKRVPGKQQHGAATRTSTLSEMGGEDLTNCNYRRNTPLIAPGVTST